MKYMALIYYDPAQAPVMGSPDQQLELADYYAFADELFGSGRGLAGEPLEPPSTAKTVRLRDGKSVITDGPFAETKEVLGGFYLLEAGDIDEALAWAAKIPTARYGAIEVRPLMVLPPMS